MKILIAPDKFKGSLSALEVAQAVERGIRRVSPEVHCRIHPLADGGDGSLKILSTYLDLKPIKLPVTGPLGAQTEACYFRLGDAAYIELAEAAGLVLLQPALRNPLYTTTYGVGELIRHAILQGAREINLFLGGSATQDGGTGIAQALGFRFLDDTGSDLHPTGENLIHIQQIIPPPAADLAGVAFHCLCDVQNPLLGANGSCRTYAAQKGASPEVIEALELGMEHFAQVVNQTFHTDITQVPGGGAAGGVAAGMFGLLQADIKSGIDTLLALSQFEEQVKNADLIISGEGKLDTQTLDGKVIAGVLQVANRWQKPLLLVVGQSELPPQSLAEKGILDVLTVSSRCSSIAEAMENASPVLEALVADFFHGRP